MNRARAIVVGFSLIAGLTACASKPGDAKTIAAPCATQHSVPNTMPKQ